MSLSDPNVLITVFDDDSAKFTIVDDEENHRFSASPVNDAAIVEYEETLSWRGVMRNSEPREEVWKALFQSEEMTAYLNEYGITHARRANH